MDKEASVVRFQQIMDKEASVPIVTIKAKIDVVDEIRKALTPTQRSIFEKTCFGHWLDVRLKKNSQLLIHTLLTCMFDGKANELSFLVLDMDIGGHPSYTSLCPQTAVRENSEGFGLGVDTTVYLVEMLYIVRP
nr:hypothetical protein [Tanacetum cinerariifolium]